MDRQDGPSDQTHRRREPPDPHVRLFVALRRRRPLVTGVLLLSAIAFYVIASALGGAGDPGTLVLLGARTNESMAGGQWWRLVTASFLHADLVHLAFNLCGLWLVGRLVEPVYGHGRFLALYLAVAVAGNAASYAFKAETITVGASGAIYGLVGILAAFALRWRHGLPLLVARGFTLALLPYVVALLVFGLNAQGVDQAAHLGGLAAGLILGLAVPAGFIGGRRRRDGIVLGASVAVLLSAFGGMLLGLESSSGPAGRIGMAQVLLARVVEAEAELVRYTHVLGGRLRAWTHAGAAPCRSGDGGDEEEDGLKCDVIERRLGRQVELVTAVPAPDEPSRLAQEQMAQMLRKLREAYVAAREGDSRHAHDAFRESTETHERWTRAGRARAGR